MSKVVVVSYARTAISTFGGSLKSIPAADLAVTAIKGALEKKSINPELVDEVILGCVGQFGEDAFISRVAAINAGIPASKNAYTVNRLCGSGLQAINNGIQQILTKQSDIVVAGGVENMDRYPYLDFSTRFGNKMGHVQLEDGLTTALSDPFNKYAMGITAENVADMYSITREEQDLFAYESQMKAKHAIVSGYFDSSIVPVEVPQRKGDPIIFDKDEHPRFNTTLESLAKLRPAFKKDGTVTAASSSGINSGAAVLVLMSEEKAQELSLEPLAYLTDHATAGVEPEIMGVAPAYAIEKLLNKNNYSIEDIDLVELNEAFAAQVLGVLKIIDIPKDRLNVNGGAIALGHPIGASGAIVTIKLIEELRRTGKNRGISSLCIGGGQGIATLVQIKL